MGVRLTCEKCGYWGDDQICALFRKLTKGKDPCFLRKAEYNPNVVVVRSEKSGRKKKTAGGAS